MYIYLITKQIVLIFSTNLFTFSCFWCCCCCMHLQKIERAFLMSSFLFIVIIALFIAVVFLFDILSQLLKTCVLKAKADQSDTMDWALIDYSLNKILSTVLVRFSTSLLIVIRAIKRINGTIRFQRNMFIIIFKIRRMQYSTTAKQI